MSGQALTQAMQPTHCSAMNCGMRGASRLKSRVAAVPGGMMLRARPDVGRPLRVGDAAPVRRHDRRAELLDVRRRCRTAAVRDRRARPRAAPSSVAGVLGQRRSSGTRRHRGSPLPMRARDEVGRSRARRWAVAASSSSTTTSRWMWSRSILPAATSSGAERSDGDGRAASSGAGPRARASSPTATRSRARAARSVWRRRRRARRRRRRPGSPLTSYSSMSRRPRPARHPARTTIGSIAMRSPTVGRSSDRSIAFMTALRRLAARRTRVRSTPAGRPSAPLTSMSAVVGLRDHRRGWRRPRAPPRLPKNRPSRSPTAVQQLLRPRPARRRRTARRAGTRRRARRPASADRGPAAARGAAPAPRCRAR